MYQVVHEFTHYGTFNASKRTRYTTWNYYLCNMYSTSTYVDHCHLFRSGLPVPLSTFWTCIWYDIITRHDDDSNKFVCVLISKMQMPATQHLHISLDDINLECSNLLTILINLPKGITAYKLPVPCYHVVTWYQVQKQKISLFFSYSYVPFEQRNIDGCGREIFVLLLVRQVSYRYVHWTKD